MMTEEGISYLVIEILKRNYTTNMNATVWTIALGFYLVPAPRDRIHVRYWKTGHEPVTGEVIALRG